MCQKKVQSVTMLTDKDGGGFYNVYAFTILDYENKSIYINLLPVIVSTF